MNTELALAAALLGSQVPASAPPCGTAMGEDVKLFDAVAPAAAIPTTLKLERRARLTASFPLQASTRNLASTYKGRPVALSFSRVLRPDGQGARWCTSGSGDHLPRVEADGPHLLYCLVDADGDGRFEAAQAQARLVPMNARRRADPPAPAPTYALPTPLTLEAAGQSGDGAPGWFKPRVMAEVRVVRMSDSAVEIERQMQPELMPVGDRFRSWGDAQRWTVPLREGAWTAPDGLRILLTRSGNGWTAIAANGWFPAPTLACDGAYVLLPGKVAVIGTSGLAVFDRPTSQP